MAKLTKKAMVEELANMGTTIYGVNHMPMADVKRYYTARMKEEENMKAENTQEVIATETTEQEQTTSTELVYEDIINAELELNEILGTEIHERCNRLIFTNGRRRVLMVRVNKAHRQIKVWVSDGLKAMLDTANVTVPGTYVPDPDRKLMMEHIWDMDYSQFVAFATTLTLA